MKRTNIMYRKKKSSHGLHKNENILPEFHKYSAEETVELRLSLLNWYDENKRDLPWRNLDEIKDINSKAYAVLVSEVMAQQTQVVTVIDYFLKWMKKWPTMESLASASLEEVREAWAGLGYYSRAERLHKAVCEVVSKFKGSMPRTAEELQKLPGIGRYTSCAVASIVFNEPVAVVDGNVIRVLTRLRTIGSSVQTSRVTTALWDIANKIVDHQRPGDFNQAVMELGAILCSPKSPNCEKCPLKKHCRALQQVNYYQRRNESHLYQRSEDMDIEDIKLCSENCDLCLPKDIKWDPSLGVRNYPAVTKRLAIRKEHIRICILYRINDDDGCKEFFVVQRPKTGLLANLWEFPTLLPEDEKSILMKKDDNKAFLNIYRIPKGKTYKNQYLGTITHVFSHLTHVYYVGCLKLDLSPDFSLTVPANYQAGKWCSEQQVNSMAVSSVVKKILFLFKKEMEVKKWKKLKVTSESPIIRPKKQSKLSSYFL